MLLKLLLTVGVIVAVLYGARLFTSATRGDSRGSGGDRLDRSAGGGRQVDRAEDLEACPVCGAYTTGDTKAACEREDCPYRG